jgi:hypothetical protein
MWFLAAVTGRKSTSFDGADGAEALRSREWASNGHSVVASWVREGLRALDTDCLELVGVETEQSQDCWGNLRRLHRRRDGGAASRSVP